MHRASQHGIPRARALARQARRARGAAYVEGVTVVLFLIIIFAGVQYLGRYYVQRQHALEIARSCAWMYSANACQYDDPNDSAPIPAVPDHCRAVLQRPTPDEDSEVLAQIAQKRDEAMSDNGANPASLGGRQAELNEGVNEKLGPLVEMAFGQYFQADAEQSVDRVPVLANAEGSVSAWYYMPCNLKHEDPFDTAIDLFGKLIPEGL